MMKTHGLTGLLLALLLLAAPAWAAEENTVVIGCDVYAPYTYKDGTGDFIGIDVQLAHEAFGRLGYDVEFREIAWENKDKALASGEVDCIWSCFTMNGREDVYTWAGPYLYSRQVALVRADSDYTELSQLNGGRAAVQASTTAENALVKRESAVAAGAGAGALLLHRRGGGFGAAQGICGYGGGARERHSERRPRVAGKVSHAGSGAVCQRAGRGL